MAAKEARARIKINRLLEESGWRFFDDDSGPANIVLEPNVKITESAIDALGGNFETIKNGFVDFLLLDAEGFPFIVLEAKAEDKNPLVGKEQARTYAKSQGCRFILLSNGNLHYFWDLERGNPRVITSFPEPESVAGHIHFHPSPEMLCDEKVGDDYIALTQYPTYSSDAGWQAASERQAFIKKNRLRCLREYQKQAIEALQLAASRGDERCLFEMATGTGKTLTAAAVIKLFLRSGNARRVLFLVDRLELEEQANKSFKLLLKNDFSSVIYKEQRDDWRKAEIVVTTVQSLLFNNKYKQLFSPTDFDLVISDEAHRSIGGNARAVFEYFVGYKLGLTATPKDYLKKFDPKKPTTRDPRELERRLLLDTYRTFGCESGEPTFRYSLLDGVRDGFLINPVTVDARTEITTQLLADKGYAVMAVTEGNEDKEQTYYQRDFEKKFFSKATNQVFCETFLKNALRDPVSGEIGKTIVFAVSQKHAAKLTQILNELADVLFPGRYNSDFAIQVTSQIKDAQQYTLNFANNNLLGSENFVESYKTSKARVCVTVGMMTTGYDCTDIMNLCMMRPIFSPTDFVQIKGRGTRPHDFLEELHDPERAELVKDPDKTRFKLFDFFANCEYFEEKFNYDEVLVLPAPSGRERPVPPPPPPPGNLYVSTLPDALAGIAEEQIGAEGMRVDRMFFETFEDKVKEDAFVQEQVAAGEWQPAIDHVLAEFMDKPAEYFTLDKLRKAAGVDRQLPLREILQKIFGLIPYFKSKDELLEEEFQKFVLDYKPNDPGHIVAMKYYFKAYISDARVRDIIESKRLTDLNVNPSFTMHDFQGVPPEWRNKIPQYVKDYVSINSFTH